ncbi:MAG: OB-fold domain-containing protein, partial [Pseudomonadota bacterium]|nr:OB-fold domain-containing protein [Pseudomonadota bacterium]
PAFADCLPYTVATVELEEGPRLISNIVTSGDPEALRIDQPLRLAVEQEHGIAVARFKPV